MADLIGTVPGDRRLGLLACFLVAGVCLLAAGTVALFLPGGAGAEPSGQADLSITKTDSADPVTVGESFTYTLTVQNLSFYDNAADVTVTDTIPASLSLDSYPGSCSATGNDLTCSLGTLNQQASQDLEIGVTPAAAGTETNTTYVNSTTPDPDNSNDSASQSTTISAGPTPQRTLSVIKEGSGSGTVTSSPGLINCGSTCQDSYDDNTAVFLTATPDPGSTFTGWGPGACAGTPGEVCSLFTDADKIARATFDTTPPPQADLSIQVSASNNPSIVGQPLTYTLRVENHGPDNATDIVVTNPLPPSVTVNTPLPSECAMSGSDVVCQIPSLNFSSIYEIALSVTPTATGQISNTASVNSTSSIDPNQVNDSDTLVVQIDPVPDGNLSVSNIGSGSGTVVSSPAGINCGSDCSEDYPGGTAVALTATPAPGSVFAGWDIDCAGSSGNTCNLTMDADKATNASFTLSSGPVADLSMTKTDSADPVTVGKPFSYTLRATNSGPDTATNVRVEDPLPAGISVTGGLPAGCANTGATVSCQLGSIAPGQSRSVSIGVTASQTGPVSNTATVESVTSQDPNPANDSGTEQTSILAPPEPEPPPPPVATFTAPETVKRGEPITFDTTGSVRAERYLWDFNGDKQFDFVSLPSEPYVAFRPQRPSLLKPTMTAVSATGATSIFRTTVNVRPGVSLLAKRPPETAVAASSLSAFASVITSKLPPNCSDKTLAFGVVEVRGCMNQVLNREAIPRAERKVALEYFDLNAFFGKFTETCDFRIRGCAAAAEKEGFPVEVTKKPVQINGMTITPVGRKASIVIFPGAKRIVSSNAKLSFGGELALPVPLPPKDLPVGPINMNVSAKTKSLTSGREKMPVFSFDAKKSLPTIGGFPIDGRIDLKFVKDGGRRYSDLTVRLNLPPVFEAFGKGPQPGGQVTIEADNTNGTVLSRLFFGVPEAFIGGVRLANLSFTYQRAGEPSQGCSRKWWKVTAEIFLIPSDPSGKPTGLRLAPEPPRNGIAFCAGSFFQGGAELIFGNAEPQIFPGVFLNAIQFDMQLDNPLLFSGGATITAAKLVTARGGLLAAFASPGAPYTIRSSDANGTLGGLNGRRVISTAFAVGGTVGVKVPEAGAIGFGQAYALYAYPDYIAAGGNARIQTLFFTIIAQAGLEINTSSQRFNISAGGDVCVAGGFSIAGYSGCVGGLGLVSSKGAVACLYLPRGIFEPGLGFYWRSKKFEAFLGTAGDGCKPSEFTEKNVQGLRSLARQAVASGAPAVTPRARVSAALSFKVEKGDLNKNIRLEGSGGAPAVTVTAPNGETITSVPNSIEHGPRLRVFAAESLKTTWIGMDKPVPGTYMVTPKAGSVPITGAAETNYEPDRIKASVKGKGAKRILRYSVTPSPGQVTRFYESGTQTRRLLATVKRGEGVVRFKPSPGPGGKRTIVAEVEVEGLPGQPQTVAAFKTTTTKAGKVKGVKVRRVKQGLSVRWRRARNAARYELVVVQANGVKLTRFLKPKTKRLVVKQVPKTLGGRVHVAALGPLGDWGKAGKARFKATKRVKDRLLPYSQLGKGRPKKR